LQVSQAAPAANPNLNYGEACESCSPAKPTVPGNPHDHEGNGKDGGQSQYGP
jgi:hypothetical protein